MAILVGWLSVAPVFGERLAVNDRKAPAGREDLEMIQKALVAALPKARQATVCLDLADGSGSGVIVSADGLILTAAHVSTAVGKPITVVLEDGRRVKGESLGLVASSDAAMVKILEGGPFPFVEIDRAETAKLGDWVFAVGHSGGYDKERGAVVRLGRLVRMAQATFQSDCALIGGDSGGPLFDLTGRLIGIHSRVGEQLQVNMHVPMREFTGNWEGMLRSEFIGEGPFATRPEKGSGYLGVATEPGKERGLRVTRVGPGSPAESAGVMAGDLLLKWNGTLLENREQMMALLAEMAAGDKLELQSLRNGTSKIFNLRLGER